MKEKRNKKFLFVKLIITALHTNTAQHSTAYQQQHANRQTNTHSIRYVLITLIININRMNMVNRNGRHRKQTVRSWFTNRNFTHIYLLFIIIIIIDKQIWVCMCSACACVV